MTYANKGQSFEQLLITTHSQYKRLGIGIIEKVPTHFKVLRGYNKQKKRTEIKGAFPVEKSTVDFLGHIYGIPVAIEAKETSNKTSFYIPSVKQHQYEFLRAWQKTGGRSFVIVNFVELQEVYLLPFMTLEDWQAAQKRASIPIAYIRAKAYKVEPGMSGAPMHYAHFIN